MVSFMNGSPWQLDLKGVVFMRQQWLSVENSWSCIDLSGFKLCMTLISFCSFYFFYYFFLSSLLFRFLSFYKYTLHYLGSLLSFFSLSA